LTSIIKLMALWEQRYIAECQTTNIITKEKIKNERIRSGLHIQAYLLMSFKSRSITGDKIPANIFHDMLRGLITYIFIEDSLKLLLQIDYKVTLQILYIVFHG
jgi:hypothetical protein